MSPDNTCQLSFDLGYQTLYGRDNLVVSRANCAVVEFIDHWPNWRMPVTVIVGERGSGKSHLADIWCEKANAIPIDSKNLKEAVSLAMDGHSIFIDNLGPENIDEVALFHLFNVVKQNFTLNKQTSLLITSHITPVRWFLAINDLISRLRTVNIISIESPDDLLLRGVLVKLLSDRQLVFDATLLDYILIRIDRSLEAVNSFVKIIDDLVIDKQKRANRTMVAKALDIHMAMKAENSAGGLIS